MASNGNGGMDPLLQILSSIEGVRAEIAGLRADLAGAPAENEFSETLPAAAPVSATAAAAGQGPVVRLENLARLGFGTAAKGKKDRKFTTPRAAPTSWLLFTGRIHNLLKRHGYEGEALGKTAQQFAADLKAEESDLSAWSDEEILARRAVWSPPEVTRGEAASGKSWAKPGARRNPWAGLTPELKAEKVATMKVARAAGESAPAAAAAAQPAGEFKPVLLGGVRYLVNMETGHAYLRNEDGSQGEWAGIFVKGPKPYINTSVAKPELAGGKRKSTRKHKHRHPKKTRKH